MDTLLQTERLIWRRFTTADADHLYRLDNDPAVMRYINGGTAVSRTTIETEILPAFLQYDPAQPLLGFWVASHKATGDFVGWFSLRSTGTTGEGVLGYRLRRAVWGQGLATEGVRALLALGFTQGNRQRIVATTYEANLASRRVMEKAGMTFVRAFRITPQDILDSDSYHAQSIEVWDGDDVEYGINKSEWEQL